MTEVLHKELSYAVVGAAIEVHNELGPGFLETIYHKALCHELRSRSIAFEEEKALPVFYKGQLMGEYRADIVVDGKIILELKAASALTKAHEAQALHYLTTTGLQLAILLNFGTSSLQQKRIAKSLPSNNSR